MKTFVVSYISFYDNDLLSKIVKADNEKEALLQGCYELTQTDQAKEIGHWSENEFFNNLAHNTVEEIKTEMFDCDSACNVIEVTV